MASITTKDLKSYKILSCTGPNSTNLGFFSTLIQGQFLYDFWGATYWA